jgi:hypothetical protein
MTRSWLTICIYTVGLVAGTLLLIQHRVHIPAFLPYLVFLACPLVHLFMHQGHGGHRHDGEPKADQPQAGNPTPKL